MSTRHHINLVLSGTLQLQSFSNSSFIGFDWVGVRLQSNATLSSVWILSQAWNQCGHHQCFVFIDIFIGCLIARCWIFDWSLHDVKCLLTWDTPICKQLMIRIIYWPFSGHLAYWQGMVCHELWCKTIWCLSNNWCTSTRLKWWVGWGGGYANSSQSILLTSSCGHSWGFSFFLCYLKLHCFFLAMDNLPAIKDKQRPYCILRKLQSNQTTTTSLGGGFGYNQEDTLSLFHFLTFM